MQQQNEGAWSAGGEAQETGVVMAEPVRDVNEGLPGGQSGEFRRLVEFKGNGWQLFKIWIVNFLLTVLTLGIYHFWAKVKVRKYLWSNTVVEGEPLEYTGTGKELFFGFLIIAVVFVVYNSAVHFYVGPAQQIVPSLLLIALVPFWFFATYRAIRYRLTRTVWRGIRFNLSGSAWRFTLVALGQTLLNIITLYLWYPKSRAVLRKRIVGNMWYGSRSFWFTGKAKPLYVPFLVALVGMIGFGGAGMMLVDLGSAVGNLNEDPGRAAVKGLLVALGTVYGMLLLGSLSTYWFAAVCIRWEAMNTRFPGVEFRSTITLRRMLWLELTNLLLRLCTLGFAAPWLIVRSHRVYLHSLHVQGDLDYVHLAQDEQNAPKHGEGFFEAFDLDLAV